MTAPAQEPLLRCVEVVQEFEVRQRGRARKARVSAVDGVSFEIQRGDALAVVGETGSGKSSLGRALISAPAPRSGQITIAGHEVFGPNRDRKARLGQLVQMMFQDPLSALDPRWTVERLVSEPLAANRQISEAARRRAVAEILARVGLSASRFGDRRAGGLSGGEAQRVAIARALISSPELIVCDEPVTALDVSVQAQILGLLYELKRDLGLTYLLVAHDLAVVRVVADRVATMYLGRLCEIGPTESIFAQAAHPYTAALLSAIPPPLRTDEGLPTAPRRERVRLRGEPPSPTEPPSGCRFRTRCASATDRCAQETPRMREATPGHLVACHHPLIPVPSIATAETAALV